MDGKKSEYALMHEKINGSRHKHLEGSGFEETSPTSPRKDEASNSGGGGSSNDHQVTHTLQQLFQNSPISGTRFRGRRMHLANKEQIFTKSGTFKSRLMNPEDGGLSQSKEIEDDPFANQIPLKYRNKYVIDLWVLLEATALVSIISVLFVHRVRVLRVGGLPFWKWLSLLLVVLCGKLISDWLVKIAVFFIEINFFIKKKVMYFVYSLRRVIRYFIWATMVFGAWCWFLEDELERELSSAAYIKRVLLNVCFDTLVWLIKNLFLKLVSSSYHLDKYFEKIQEALFAEYVIERLSGTRLQGDDRNIITFRKFPKVTVSECSLRANNISAWKMKSFVKRIRNSSITFEERMHHDSGGPPNWQRKTIESELMADLAAKEIFQNVAEPNADSIFLSDIERFMSPDEAKRALTLFGITNHNQGVGKKAFADWLINAFKTRKCLSLTLKESSTGIKQLRRFVNSLVIALLVGIAMVTSKAIPNQVLLLLLTQILSFSFLYGETLKIALQNIVFIFVSHPFDVGDTCIIEGKKMVVNKIEILQTEFVYWDNQLGKQTVLYPNNLLSRIPIAIVHQ